MDGVRKPGTRVRLKDINGAPHFNGYYGVVGTYDAATKRQSVQLDGGGAISVRLECMEDVGFVSPTPAPVASPVRSMTSHPTASPVRSVPMGAFHRSTTTSSAAGGAPEDSASEFGRALTAEALSSYQPSIGDKVEVDFAGFPSYRGTVQSISEGLVFVAKEDTGQLTAFPEEGPQFRQSEKTFEPPPRRPALAHSSSITPEYAKLMTHFGPELESLTLKGLFEFIDDNGSGNLSFGELEQAVPVIAELMRRRDGIVTRIDLATIDEDGNGVINFSEFAEWAGPRLGLPLGVSLDFSACGIIGCPCHSYRPIPPDRPRRKKKKKTFISAAVWALSGGKSDTSPKWSPELCQCKHKRSAHQNVSTDAGGEIPYPDNWTNQRGSFVEFVNIPFHELARFQGLLDQTYKNTWTRDRKKHNPLMSKVPSGFKVISVQRAENSKNWKEYMMKKASVLEDRANAEEGSWVEINNVKSNTSFKNLFAGPAIELSHAVNEWILFHGTSECAAQAICRTDFKISFAGGSTGTLYGKGIYLAESITKADEYAKPDAFGNYTVLLCRTLGGNVRYTDEVDPDPEELVMDCIEGPYGCVVGDREKCRGTYREFVVFDTEDVYPEYIIKYQRCW